MAKRGTRRLKTVPAVILLAVVLTLSAPVWVPTAALADLVRGRLRLPVLRLMLFAVWWAWAETCGIIVLGAIWAVGRAGSTTPQYRLQRWWCFWIISALKGSVGMRLDVTLPTAVPDKPLLVLCRHASLADSIISCYVVNNKMHLDPRYVLKSDLMNVPCLDILGHRTPNCFVTRGTDSPQDEAAAVARMAAGMVAGDAAVIFPEGSRASDAKRTRELEKIAGKNPERHGRLSALTHLIPPKTGGVQALLDASPDADVMTVWHHGLDGMDTFGGIIRGLRSGRPRVHVVAEIHDRSTVPGNDSLTGWLDNQWLRMDAEVAAHSARTGMTGAI